MSQNEERITELFGFNIDWTKREVWTNCGDYYYDYSISFSELIQLVKYIDNEIRRENVRT